MDTLCAMRGARFITPFPQGVVMGAAVRRALCTQQPPLLDVPRTVHTDTVAGTETLLMGCLLPLWWLAQWLWTRCRSSQAQRYTRLQEQGIELESREELDTDDEDEDLP